jgi:hypothetical protein
MKIMFKLITVISLIFFQVIRPHQTSDMGSCGRIQPKITHYITGGKFSMVEQWPWQVRCRHVNKTCCPICY